MMNLMINYLIICVFFQQSNGHISITGDVYQDRLNRLESDKESLVLQVTFLNTCMHIRNRLDSKCSDGKAWYNKYNTQGFNY